MTRIAGKHALLKMFESEEVEYMFGNPGTSEAPMMAVMDQYPSIEYVLVLQGRCSCWARRGLRTLDWQGPARKPSHRQRDVERTVPDDRPAKQWDPDGYDRRKQGHSQDCTRQVGPRKYGPVVRKVEHRNHPR